MINREWEKCTFCEDATGAAAIVRREGSALHCIAEKGSNQTPLAAAANVARNSGCSPWWEEGKRQYYSTVCNEKRIQVQYSKYCTSHSATLEASSNKEQSGLAGENKRYEIICWRYYGTVGDLAAGNETTMRKRNSLVGSNARSVTRAHKVRRTAVVGESTIVVGGRDPIPSQRLVHFGW